MGVAKELTKFGEGIGLLILIAVVGPPALLIGGATVGLLMYYPFLGLPVVVVGYHVYRKRREKAEFNRRLNRLIEQHIEAEESAGA